MITIAALYKFTPLNPPDLKEPLQKLCHRLDVRGSLLLATEGVNGTIAGSRAAIDAVLAHLQSWPGCADLDWKESTADQMPFGRMKVRLKREIVTMGAPVNPRAGVGTYVAPQDWNDLIRDPDTVLIDTRNDYEVALGSFPGAEDPGTQAFGELPAWLEANRDRLQGKRVAMFCTGGIRCEKSTAYLKAQGMEEVYHLKGGILKYLEEVPQPESLWQGECFVFDQRVSVGQDLVPGRAVLCHACRRPVQPEDRHRPEWEEGVQCHNCAGTHTDAQRARFRERMRQINRARDRGDSHLGPHPARRKTVTEQS